MLDTDNGAFYVNTPAGGIKLKWNDEMNLRAEGGNMIIKANADNNQAILLHAVIGITQTIELINEQGTNEGAITLSSLAGGVDIDAAQGKDVNISGGQIALSSKANADNTE